MNRLLRRMAAGSGVAGVAASMAGTSLGAQPAGRFTRSG